MSSHQPFIIGVAGGSGSGKTTVVSHLLSMAGPSNAISLAHDNYYKDQSHLPMEERVLTNYDHPSSLETPLLVKQLEQLRSGQHIEEPVYDFVHHTRDSATIHIEPAPIILVEGILIFDSKSLRSLFDLKVFVDTPDDIRLLRRLQRDITERGRTLDSVIEQYMKTVRPMYLEFVEPTKRCADIIIPEGGENTVALDLLNARVQEIARS